MSEVLGSFPTPRKKTRTGHGLKEERKGAIAAAALSL